MMDLRLIDILWVGLAALLCFIMQGGFLLLETGLSRAKSNISVAIKNLTDFGISVVCFWAFGFAIMFGTSFNGWFGTDLFFVNDTNSSWMMIFFIFQSMFCATTSTIVSGAAAERIRYYAYIFITLVIATIIYPIFGHWVWGSAFWGNGEGWLESIGFRDFAGSTVVHSVGGWCSLAVILILGPRHERFSEYVKKNGIPSSNLPLAAMGALILWFGWFGFNGGSVLGVDESLPGIWMTTNMAACSGIIITLILGRIEDKRINPSVLINGALGGLVAITACCHVVSIREAVFIGGIAGGITILVSKLLVHFEMDDVVGAIPVHLACGVWGTLCVAIFGDLETLGTGHGRLKQLGIQGAGVLACFVWSFLFGGILFFILNKIYSFRVTREEEVRGLNTSENLVTDEVASLHKVLQKHAQTGDLSERAPVEPYTEVGQIATLYNQVMENLEDRTSSLRNFLNYTGQGFLSFDSRLIVGKESSKACGSILGVSPVEGRDISELLYSGEVALDNFRESMRLIFEKKSSPEVIFKLCDESIWVGGKEIKVKYEYLGNHRVMLILTDTTEEKKLKEKLTKVTEEQQQLLNVISNNKFFETLMLDAKELFQFLDSLKEKNSYSKKEIDSLALMAHTFKGNLGFFGFSTTISVAHEFESYLVGLEESTNADSIQKYFNPLKTSFDEEIDYFKKKLGEEWIERFNTLQVPLIKIQTVEKIISENYASDTELTKKVGDLKKVPIGKFINRFSRLADNLSVRLDKRIKPLEIIGQDIQVSSDRYEKLCSNCVHLIRNIMDHGIESPVIRKKLNKDPEGKITIHVKEESEQIKIIFRDDGQGIDITTLKSKAKELGIKGANSMSQKDALHLIFNPRLSTKKVVTDISGRGVGMASVKEVVEKLGGSISITSEWEKGTEFTILIPEEK